MALNVRLVVVPAFTLAACVILAGPARAQLMGGMSGRPSPTVQMLPHSNVGQAAAMMSLFGMGNHSPGLAEVAEDDAAR